MFPKHRRGRRLIGAAIMLLGLLDYSSVYAAQLDVVYQIETASSGISTTGGYAGGGIGDFGLGGSFRLTIDADVVRLQSIDVQTSPGSAFVFPPYPGSVNTQGPAVVTFFGEQQNAAGYPPNKYNGRVENGNLTLQGVYIEAFPDGVNFYYDIRAKVVPLPPAFVLLFSGLVALAGLGRTVMTSLFSKKGEDLC